AIAIVRTGQDLAEAHSILGGQQEVAELHASHNVAAVIEAFVLVIALVGVVVVEGGIVVPFDVVFAFYFAENGVAESVFILPAHAKCRVRADTEEHPGFTAYGNLADKVYGNLDITGVGF